MNITTKHPGFLPRALRTDSALLRIAESERLTGRHIDYVLAPKDDTARILGELLKERCPYEVQPYDLSPHDMEVHWHSNQRLVLDVTEWLDPGETVEVGEDDWTVDSREAWFRAVVVEAALVAGRLVVEFRVEGEAKS